MESYWSVAWTFAPGESHHNATLDDPCAHLTVERGDIRRTGHPGPGAWLTGPVSVGRFDATLTGSGDVVGVKFTVGGLCAFADVAMPELRDSTVPAAAWFPLLPQLPGDAVEAKPELDAWLLGLDPVEPPGFDDFRGLLEMSRDTAVTSVEALADVSGVGLRTTQRLFRRFAGVGVKRMLVRHRVIDAVALLDARPETPLAEVATDLGWFDQAHFTRDFRSITGLTPAHYAARRG